MSASRSNEESTNKNNFKQAYEATRKSLIARLTDWNDQKTWDEFYKTYWKLIYSVSIEAGLKSEEAFDVVQETIITIAKQSKKSLYDPERGSFKAWLMNMTRWRIKDQFRKRKKDTASSAFPQEDGEIYNPVEHLADPNGELLEKLWDSEWKKQLTNTALERVKPHVSAKQYQIFHCYVIQEWSTKKVQDQLNVSVGQVYLAKHRVGVLFKKELQMLEKDEEAQL